MPKKVKTTPSSSQRDMPVREKKPKMGVPTKNFDTPKKGFSFAGWGAVGTLVLALFLFVAVNAKITGKPYVGLEYWLQVLEDMPVTIPINELFTLIEPVNLPDWLIFAEVPLNFVLNVINLFAGSVGVLLNLVKMLEYFVLKFVLFIAG